MENTAHRAIAIVGVGAVLPDAPNVPAFWENVKNSRYSVSEVTPDRWNADYYYDPDPKAPDKSYTKIGGWVRDYPWDPMKWKMPIPPRVVEAMDGTQKWAIACTREALEDYGYPKRPFDPDRTAVILGNAMAGETHYRTSLRVFFPEYAHELDESTHFASLPEALRKTIIAEMHDRMGHLLPQITEDSMPGELSNCIAGRIANIFNFHGPNYVVDAACASAMAAFSAAVEGLIQKNYDVVVAGGIDRNMGAPTFVKFCKIGALSATGTRPYAQGADGFVMGEGAAIFLLKRLADAERDNDKIYAVLRGMGGASDGKGKGITAPNPVGQRLAVQRGWENASLTPTAATLFEGHGTSTRVGDVVEAQSLVDVLNKLNLPKASVALGSVKSNFGHLKGAAGAAGMLKATLALHNKVLPPSLHCEHPSPDIDFAHSPLYVNTELKPWTVPAEITRRAGVSAFGFGGTNFHAVLEEYIPGRLNGNGKHSVAVGDVPSAVPAGVIANAKPASTPATPQASSPAPAQASYKAPLRGALVIGANSDAEIIERLQVIQKDAAAGHAPAPAAPAESDLKAPERLAIDYADAAELADKSAKALKALKANQAPIWKALRPQGIFRGRGPAPKVAFLYTGQGSQYVNMIAPLRAVEPIVAELFTEADRIMTPMLGKPLSNYIFVDQNNADAVAKAEEDLRQTEITQPTVLTIDLALTRLLAAYGIQPDMTMGHSLGEYGALVASGSLSFEDALAAVSARGRGMTKVAVQDTGRMAAVFAPLAEVERILKTVDGYVVIANVNSGQQSVIGGASKAVEQAMEIFLQAGFNVVPLPVSHAFHTSIVAPASEPLRDMLSHLHIQSPKIPIVANVNGEFYPTGPNVVPQMLDLLALQVASPVQFVKGLNTLYNAGARVFIEVGPKKALQGFAEEVLGERGDIVSLFTNHPKVGDIPSFNQALCGLYAAGLGRGQADVSRQIPAKPAVSQPATSTPAIEAKPTPVPATVSATVRAPAMPALTKPVTPAPAPVVPPKPATVVAPAPVAVAEPAKPMPTPAVKSAPAVDAKPAPTASVAVTSQPSNGNSNGNSFNDLGRLLSESLERNGWHLTHGEKPAPPYAPVVITGASLGLPGTARIFDDSNVERILRGDQFIAAIPKQFRNDMLEKHIRRLVKSEKGEPTFEDIADVADVIKLAGRGGAFNLETEFGVPSEHVEAFDRVTRLAIAAGIDALRDAGIPLVMRYKTTTKGTQLPDRWGLPDAMRDDTGVIFGSAFPGYDSYADEMARYYTDHERHQELKTLEGLRFLASGNGHSDLGRELDRRIQELHAVIDKEPYVFNRRFLLRVLSMGHSQFAELIGARGPNTQINAACASGAHAVGLAEDWIRAGRCRRVVIITADDVTSDHMIGWFGAGFLASGAAATDELVEEAAIPFDRRRHGLIMGMGAASIVVESADAARERGIRPICEVLGAVTGNSAFHGTRLDVQHIGQVMENLVAGAETRSGVARNEVAPKMVFVSHETYTPARGGSASAEIHALRRVFGAGADQIVIANTKGMTGHAMATGIEDVLAVKALETGLLPPVANFKEVDPELGVLNLSKGGPYPVQYALHLGAGFGSQISMILLRWVPTKDGVRPSPKNLGYAYRIADKAVWDAWLTRMAGRPGSELEVVKRTLRVRDQGLAARIAATAAESRPVPTRAATPVPVPAPQVATPVPVAVAVPAPVATVAVAVPVAAVAPKPAAPASPNSGDSADAVKDRILALVAEKTGYPIDMLDLDLDMEADLGVDTVKQAEVFASVREAYGIARDDKIKLRDYPTLAHVIRFVQDRRAAVGMAQPVAPPAPAKQEVKPAAAPSAAVSAPAAVDDVKERLLALVVEKTGYPKDMLDLDLDLEADLGVDTVKQAELFAAIRETYGIPRDENRKLRDYPTLAHVIRFVYEKRPDLAGGVTPAAVKIEPTVAPAITVATQPAAPSPAVVPPQGAVDDVKERLLALVVEKTGYPKDMLDLDLDLEADLGVDTVKQAELFAAIREAYGIPRDENRKLRDYPTLAHVIQFVYEKRPDLSPTVTPVPAVASSVPTVEATPPAASVVAPQPVAPVPAAVVPAQTGAVDDVKERLLALVVEKTGYPKDMLDLDLDLEADLGVDTVKQAELFAAIRETYGIPRDENRKLRDYPTLAHVIRFVYENRPDLAGGATPSPVKAESTVAPAVPVATQLAVPASILAPPQNAVDDVKERLLALVVEKTGYPKDMLDLDLDLEADLGVDTVKQAELFAAIRETYGIPRDENRKLRDYPTLAHVIRFVYENRPDLAGGAPPPVAAPAATTPPPIPTPELKLPTPTPAVTSSQTGAVDDVKDRLLALVVEKTGYPKDMLDLDLDLEADLGVDTVKQAELFAAIRETYGIPRDENRKLRDYPTLAHVIRFVYENRPDLAGAAAPSATVVELPTPAPASSPVPVDTSQDNEAIKQKVMDIVAEKTGYPKDMLDLDLDLEADLGIDTVKQAEMFASVRAAYNIPRDENMKLRDFPTLGHVIQFAQTRRAAPVAAPAVATAAPEPPPPASPPPKRKIEHKPLYNFDAANLIPRRVPVANLRLPLNVCKPTGVTLSAGSRVVIRPDHNGVADALTKRLQAMGVEVLAIDGAPDADALTALLNKWLAAGPVQGVYWLPALDDEGSLDDMNLATWREALRTRVKLLYTTMRTLFEQVAAPGTFLVSATRLGGQHGYDQAGATSPLGGAVVGFTKTYKRERTQALVKAVDFEAGRNAADVAEILVEETLRDPGAVELGYKSDERWTIALQEQPAVDGHSGLVLDEDSVFVVTGAAGSIVSAITADLAAASGGTFYLLDLVPEPDPNSSDLKRFVSDKDGLKRDLFARIQARGERATPALVEKELVALERAQAAQSAIDAVRAAGGTAYYFSLNLTDGDAITKVIDQVHARSGRIDVLLHAAGIERSHFLPDKDPREFDLVFDVKSDGWFNLLHAIGRMPLGATVAFSSIAGRFGNGGQTDYSAANDLLCKITSSFRTTRPDTRGIVIDWTAWGGIGMATRGSIPKMMEVAGIDMLPPEAGVPLIRRELTVGATCGELVIGNRLGILMDEWDATGGLDAEALQAAMQRVAPQGPMVGKITGMGVYQGLTMETTLDPAVQPFLYDHRIDGTPVLPGVMGIESFAEAALCVHPGWRIAAVEEVNFLAPFKFYRDEPRTVIIQGVFRPLGDDLIADCRLVGRRTLPNHPEPQETTHFTARVRLTRQAPQTPALTPLRLSSESIIDRPAIYRVYFHGPAYQVVERAWWDGQRMIGEMSRDLPGNHQPSDRPTLMSPRLIELCFQTAGLWEMGVHNRMGLPLHVEQVCWFRLPQLAEGPLYAVVTPDETQQSFDAVVVDTAGNCYLQVSGYRTVALPNTIDLEPLRDMRPVLA